MPVREVGRRPESEAPDTSAVVRFQGGMVRAKRVAPRYIRAGASGLDQPLMKERPW